METNTLIIAGVILLGVIPSFAAVIGSTAALIRLRRTPPLAETLAREYATRLDLDSLAARIAADLAAIRREHITTLNEFRKESRETDGEVFKIVRELTSSTNRSFSDLVKGLSRIEGKMDACQDHKKGRPA